MFSFITNLFKPKPKKPSKAGLTMMTKKELEKLGFVLQETEMNKTKFITRR